jgi:hypothetical protein
MLRVLLSGLGYLIAGALISYPIFCIQCIRWLLHPTCCNFGLAAVALVFSAMLWEGVVGALSGKRMRDVTAFLRQFPSSYFEIIPPESYDHMLTPEMKAELYRGAFNPEAEKRLGRVLSEVRMNISVIHPDGDDVFSDKIASYNPFSDHPSSFSAIDQIT